MATALWVVYDIIVFAVGFWFMERQLTGKENVVVAALVVLGLAIAGYSGYSDHEDGVLMSSLKEGQDFSKGQLDAISKILGSKLTLAPGTNAAIVANAAASKIDALERRIQEREWPLLRDKGQLLPTLKSIGPKSLQIFCNDDDCISLADDIDKTATNAGWTVTVVGGTIVGIGSGLALYSLGKERPVCETLGPVFQQATGYPVVTGTSEPMNTDFALSIGRKPHE